MPNTPAYTRPLRSTPGSCARTPPRRARSPAPIPGSPPCAPPAAAPSARSACASCAAAPARPRGTPAPLACGSLPILPAATARADAANRSAASPALTPLTSCAAVRPCPYSHSDNSIPPCPSARTPGAHWPCSCSAASPRPPAGLRAPPVFSEQRLQHVFVQAQICHQLPQPRVLFAQLFRFLRLAHAHPAVLRLPGIDGVLRYAHLSRYVFCLAARLHLLQGRDHLCFRVLGPRHLALRSVALRATRKSYSAVCGLEGKGQESTVVA